MLTLDRGGEGLVEGRLHAVELEFAHGGQDLGTLHHNALLRLSSRAQSAAGSCRSRSASGVGIAIGVIGSRRREGMFRITPAALTFSLSASPQPASTRGRPPPTPAVG